MRRISLTRVTLVAVLIAAGGFATAPPAGAATSAGVESFTMQGTFSCDNPACTSFSGTTSLCLETEEEPGDGTFVALPCSASFTAPITPTACAAGVCAITDGIATFSIADASDPGYTFALPVHFAGVSTSVSVAGVEHVGSISGEFETALFYSAPLPLLVWSGGGAFHAACLTGVVDACSAAGLWAVSLTGVEVHA